jgi:hypothetical protein
MILELLSSQDAISPSVSKATSSPRSITPLAFPEFPEQHYIRNPCDRFMDHGNNLLLDVDFAAELPSNQRMFRHNLPAADIINICSKIFPADIRCARFDYALMALDFLWDYECSRRRTMQEAAKRLGVNKRNYTRVLKKHRHVVDWIIALEEMEDSIDHFLATVYIGLRIWVFCFLPLDNDLANHVIDHGEGAAV